LSRIDNTLEQEAAETVDLGQFLPILLERYTQAGPAGEPGKTAVLFENLAETPAPVKANPDRLIQALTNPLDNALSFSPPGGTVHVKLEKAPTGWRITIDDQGPGVREDSADRYFERFYSERSQDDRENHSGLGLAIVKAIVRGYGGSCSLANRNEGEGNAGCRFIMILPISE
jgi:two-component system sensor histidine kinase ChvG